MIVDELKISNINGSTFSSVSSNVNDIYRITGNKNIYEEVIDTINYRFQYMKRHMNTCCRKPN